MSHPTKFDGSNLIMRAPAGAENVQDMHVFRTRHSCVSCWTVSGDELAEINSTGKIFLSVLMGGQQPPVYVGSETTCRAVMVDFGPVWPIAPRPVDRAPEPASDKLSPGDRTRTGETARGEACDLAPTNISRELLGKIVDEVFDGAIEDASVIEDIYAAIKRHEAPAPSTRMLGWQSMETAPKDGTILHLLVRPGQEDLDPLTSFHDSREPYETIGFNQLSNTTIDEWQFAGWDWCQDCITDGHGDVIGWRPFGIAESQP